MPTYATDTRLIPLSLIDYNPDQPRKFINPVALEDLKASIAERGLINPISVQEMDNGRYKLIAGERRFRACQDLGWDQIDARIWPSVMPAQETELLALVENLQRSDLNAFEIAKGYEVLSKPPHNLTQDDIAAKLGIKERSTISRYLALLELPQAILDLLPRGNIGEGHCRYIRQLADKTMQIAMARRADREGWSVRDTERAIKSLLNKKPKRKLKPDLRYEPDPLNDLWPTMSRNPAIAPTGTWHVYWEPRKILGTGPAMYSWNFCVHTPLIAPKTELADFFSKLARALQESTTDPAQEEHSAQKILETAVGSSSTGGTAELQSFDQFRVPRTEAEENELVALAVKGPGALYAWIYGSKNPLALQMKEKSWQQLGVSDPEKTVRNMVNSLRGSLPT